MTTCPRCHQPVDPQAIACPFCRTTLKAHGHPGITLHQATGTEYLCETCTYHADDTCNYPQRPYAKECTLYHDQRQPFQPIRSSRPASFSLWFRRNLPQIAILGLLGVSFLVVLYQQQQR